MFVGYDLEIRNQMSYTYATSGNDIYSDMNKIVKKEICKFIKSDGSIDASAMQDNWFPEINRHIFISHSSKDKQTAIMLAGWLRDTFGLSSFIDSCLWGYCDDLLKKIDNKYCYNRSTGYYNYKERNYSTSHVHNMLSTALNTMIDKCECLFFLNTKNSIKSEEDIFKITESPWIYNELSTIKTIRKKIPNYINKNDIAKSRRDSAMFEMKDEFPSFQYKVDMSGLIRIDFDFFEQWKNENTNSRYPLLYLYQKTNALEQLQKGDEYIGI